MVGNRSTATETITLLETEPPAMNSEELAIATWGILEKYVDTAKMVEVIRAVTVVSLL